MYMYIHMHTHTVGHIVASGTFKPAHIERHRHGLLRLEDGSGTLCVCVYVCVCAYFCACHDLLRLEGSGTSICVCVCV